MALIDELKNRLRTSESLRTMHARNADELGEECADLARAIAALEAPAPAPSELRDAPPAASEKSGDQIEASDQPEKVDGLTLPGGVEESRDQPCTCHPDDAPLECMKRYAASECQAAYGAKYFPPPPAEDFTLLDPAVLRDEPEIPDGWVAVQPGDAVPLDGPNIEYKFLDGETRDCRTAFDWAHRLIAYRIITPKAEPEIPEGFTKWEGADVYTPTPDTEDFTHTVEVIFSDGARSVGKAWTYIWEWSDTDETDQNIIAYRIITPEAEPEPEGYAPVVDAEEAKQTSIAEFEAYAHYVKQHGGILPPIDDKRADEPEGYAPVVDAEAVLDATELAQVTIDKVPPTAEVIKDATGRAKFALFGGQTHEVVEPANTEADFWARVLHPRKREEA